MKKSLTYKQIQKFDTAATQYLIKNGYYNNAKEETATSPAKSAGWTKKENTKLTANMRNVIKQIAQHFKDYSELLDDLQLDHCSVDDKTKTILLDEKGNRKFTVEGLRAYRKDVKKLDEKEVEIHIRITEDEWELTEEETELFSGIIIPEPNQSEK